MIGFQENVKNALYFLRKDTELTDVTLACEDGNQIDVHKIVLAASSPYFHNILRGHKHSHPLICMTGLKFQDLVSIVDFFYYGETNIIHENLDTFLKIAKELYIKGLNENEEIVGEEENMDSNGSNAGEKNKDINETEKQVVKNTEIKPKFKVENTLSLPKEEFSGDVKELDVKVKTMMGRGESMVNNGKRKMTRAYLCKVCGKESLLTNIRDHIEAMHLEGISIPCNICGKAFRTRNGLRGHMLVHKDNQAFIFC